MGNGATASKVVHDLRVPVLLVRATADVRQTGTGGFIGKVLMPLDGSQAGEAAVPVVVELAHRFPIQVTLLRVVSSEQHVRTIGGLDNIALPPEVLAIMEADAAEQVQRVRLSFRDSKATVVSETRSGNPAQEILKYAKENEVGLIAMSSHGRSSIEKWVLGSITDKVLQSSRIPVLLVRAK
jgi:nucleotide-binding universal stress UspA family protein